MTNGNPDTTNGPYELGWSDGYAEGYGARLTDVTEPFMPPANDFQVEEMRDLQQPCEVCGNEERGADDCLTCECPAPLDPDRLREDRDERRRMEREYPYAE